MAVDWYACYDRRDLEAQAVARRQEKEAPNGFRRQSFSHYDEEEG
jgi:hypothetical protein